MAGRLEAKVEARLRLGAAAGKLEAGCDLRFEMADNKGEKSRVTKVNRSRGCGEERRISRVKWNGIREMRSPGGGA
jgi:hypothetical protein